MEFETRSLYELLKEVAADIPERKAVVYDSDSITYSELIDKIEHAAAFMIEKGLKKGDKVAILAENSIRFLPLFLGIMRAGGVAISLNPKLILKNAIPLVHFTDAKYLFYGTSRNVVGEDYEKSDICNLFEMDDYQVFCYNTLDYSNSDVTLLDNISENPKDDSFILFTSGSTSFPKAVVLSQFGLINSNIRGAIEQEYPTDTRVLNCAAVFHIFGIQMSTMGLLNRNTVYFTTEIKADMIADVVEREQIECLISVSLIFQNILDDARLLNKTAPYLRRCMMAGSYVSPVQMAKFETGFKNAIFVNNYGLTELHGFGVIMSCRDNISVRYNTVGHHLMDVEASIWDADRGHLPAGEVGEILFRGFALKNSYYKMPPEEQGVDADGWLHTGDLGVIDEDGNLKIVGRIKDIIIKGGENIAPAEIEDAVKSSPGVADCRLLGYPDRVYGENLGACIVLSDKSEYDEDITKAYVKKAVGSFKVPSLFFIYDELPRNAAGKIESVKLKKDMIRRIRRLELARELVGGYKIFEFSAKGSDYLIEPVGLMIESYCRKFAYPQDVTGQVSSIVKDVIRSRIEETTDPNPELAITLICYKNFLRLSYTDNGIKFNFEKKSITKLIDKVVATYPKMFKVSQLSDRSQRIDFDFDYASGFDVSEFIEEHERHM